MAHSLINIDTGKIWKLRDLAEFLREHSMVIYPEGGGDAIAQINVVRVENSVPHTILNVSTGITPESIESNIYEELSQHELFKYYTRLHRKYGGDS